MGPIVSVVAMATMVATLAWPSGVLAGVSFFLFGAGPILWTISSTTLRQTVTPQAVLGRVSALFLTVNMGARPLGAALGGLVGDAWGDPAHAPVLLMHGGGQTHHAWAGTGRALAKRGWYAVTDQRAIVYQVSLFGSSG